MAIELLGTPGTSAEILDLLAGSQKGEDGPDVEGPEGLLPLDQIHYLLDVIARQVALCF